MLRSLFRPSRSFVASRRRSSPAVVESCEQRRLMAAQTLTFTGGADTVVMWTDSSGYNRFGPSYGTTYYFDANGANPAGSSSSGSIYRFNSTYTAFTINFGAGGDNFTVNPGSATSTVSLTLNGGADQDTLGGGAGNDTIKGEDGVDSLIGGTGNDRLEGGNQSDFLEGSAGNDFLVGGSGGDTLNGLAGSDTLFGQDGDDQLNGGDNADVLDGGAGNDFLEARGDSLAPDTLTGGIGSDTYAVNGYVSGGTYFSYDTVTDPEDGETVIPS